MVAISVSEPMVSAAADPGSLQRGRDYYLAGRVRELRVDGSAVSAIVDGGRAYRVRLDLTPLGLEGRCNCPYGAEGFFCKHCVASALAWLDSADAPLEASTVSKGKRGRNKSAGKAAGKGASDATSRSGRDRRLRNFLLRQEIPWLVAELLRVAGDDPLLRARLEVAAGVDAGEAFDDRHLRSRLEQAFDVGYFVDYREAGAYFRGVDEALTEVAKLTGEGFPDAARELAAYALDLLESVADRIDDSDGGLRGAIERAEEIHLDACSASAPDPVRLAEFLAERALRSEYEVFLTAVPDYVSVLGPAGMARYRELVEHAWNALPARRSGHYDTCRFTATFLMERLAECEGGTDALVEVLSRDVASAYDVLRIAQRLRDDSRYAEALEWLERGLSDFQPDPRLRTLAAECHVRTGDRGKAQELLWDNFAESPSLEAYIALRKVAGKKAFARWRDRALGVLRDQPAAGQRTDLPPFSIGYGHSTLVEVLLWERDVDGAWAAAAAGGCRVELWLQLARARADAHPDDAIVVLRAAADLEIEKKDRRSYHQAAGLLAEARTLAQRCGCLKGFDAHLLDLRTTHKPKRALREELDRAGLP
ncbi:Uncharacterized conserved protein, contains Zn finger domain [Actinopolymorpha singaporensis]|uniref:Uncharacterized conserved protein, contains Zn finger domain n=1 Tax=Actinopolymorpha singaporensis TaxID=117157 RepID=A0A1H1P529_9ACTN|nr:Uncharacterized conserved protein, contains Zn finger domain [Actinopolymorpha singaporensis]